MLGGLKKQKPRWQKVYGMVDALMTEAIGDEYRKRYFTLRAKKDVEDLISHIQEVLRERITTRDWMSTPTKKKALKKLRSLRIKIGYPERVESYPKSLNRKTYFKNVMTLSRHHFKREMRKLGKPPKRDEWFMGAHVVNAYYWPNQNEIVFPAGILQPPFYADGGDPALNYGAIGAVIAHEITHGFDDQGSLFDERGNLKNWWAPRDRRAFKERAEKLVRYYNTFTAVDEIKVNGKLTLGENIADLGGVVLAYYALGEHMKREGRLPDKDGLTPEQRFFLGLVLFERGLVSKEGARVRALSDPHAPSYTRVNGPLAHFEEFYRAFNVKRGDGMYLSPSQRAEIF
jgi:putative endopeptidase